MVILSVVIKAYCMCTFMTVCDEVWNIKHPRPNPSQTYYALQWEAKDFFSYKIDGKWVLRKYRKTDNKTKRFARNQYWEKRNG